MEGKRNCVNGLDPIKAITHFPVIPGTKKSKAQKFYRNRRKFKNTIISVFYA